MKKSITWRSVISMVLALILCVSLPVTIWAETTTETKDNGDGTTTTTTTTTTTETDEDGNTVVTVTIQKDTTGKLADGTIVENSETRTDTTTTDANGNLLGSSWVEDGSEKKTNITEDDGNEPGQPPVDVELKPGETTTGTSEPDVTTNPDGSTTTEIDRTVTATTTQTEVKVEETEDLIPDAEIVISGPAPVYDEDDNAVKKTDGTLHDGYGKDGMFDRNYLSSKTLDYICVNGVSIWVNKGTKTIVDMVIPEGTTLPDHKLLNGRGVGSSVSDWYPKSNSFAKDQFPEGTQYSGGVKINNIDNWYDEDDNLIVTVPEDGDFRYVGTGEHCVYYNARVTVVYEKNEDGTTRYDDDGNPIIKSITKSDGTPITIDGIPVTELPDGVSLKPVLPDYNGGRPTTFMLMDKDGNKVYAYCCDMDTGTVDGTWYSVSNLEDSDYYATEESEEHIRSIVMNGYWGTSDVQKEDGSYELGSLEGIKTKLRDAINTGTMENEVIQVPVLNDDGTPAVDESGNPVMQSKTMLELIDELTEGEALLATQSAIWSFSNGSIGVKNGKDGTVVLDPDGYKWNHDPANGSKTWTDKATGTSWDLGTLDDFGSARVDFLYKWLIALQTEEESTVVINDQNFVEDLSLTVLDKVAEEMANQDENDDNDVYNTNLNFKLAFIPGENDDLLVQITYVDLDGKQKSLVKRLAGNNTGNQTYPTITPDENGNYVIENIKLSENMPFAFDLRLEGTQYLEHGVYVYSPVGGRDVSQTFVGIAEGNRNVDVSIGVSINFNVDEDNKTIYERVWHDDGDPQYDPDDPDDPDDPTYPSGDGDDPDGGEYTPMLLSFDEEIEDEEVPLNEEPEEEEDYEEDEEIEILDEEIPLAEVPETGDASDIMMLVAILAAIGLIAVNLPAKKRYNV